MISSNCKEIKQVPIYPIRITKNLRSPNKLEMERRAFFGRVIVSIVESVQLLPFRLFFFLGKVNSTPEKTIQKTSCCGMDSKIFMKLFVWGKELKHLH